MKRQFFKLSIITLILCCILFAGYYIFYLRNINIYDLENIEFSGISQEKSKDIKAVGITPINNSVPLYIKKGANNIPGCFKSIKIILPDTLLQKVTAVAIILKSQTFFYNIKDINVLPSSQNMKTLVLPTEMKSIGTFRDKISSAYPFNIIFPVFKTIYRIFIIVFKVLLVISGVLLIAFLLIMAWKTLTKLIPKNKSPKLNKVLYFVYVIFIVLIIDYTLGTIFIGFYNLVVPCLRTDFL